MSFAAGSEVSDDGGPVGDFPDVDRGVQGNSASGVDSSIEPSSKLQVGFQVQGETYDPVLP